MTPGRKWTIWLAIVTVTFLVLEIPALVDPARGDTLSEVASVTWLPVSALVLWLFYHFAFEMAPGSARRRHWAVLPRYVSAAWGVAAGAATVVAALFVWA